MIPHDSIPQSEVDANIDQFNSDYRRIRHSTGCDACDEEQKLTGRINAMCKICERQMLAEEGKR